MPQLAQVAAVDIAKKYSEIVRNSLSRYPGPVVRPIEWTTLKQQRYVLWLLNGQAYHRTQSLVYYVMAQPGDNGSAEIQITHFENFNPRGQPYRPYVTGKWQQRFHARTGWQIDDPQFEQIETAMQNDLVAILKQFNLEEL